MQQTLTHGKIQSLAGQLLDVLFSPVEAVQDPRLLGFMFFAQGQDFVVAFHIMQDHRLLQGFRKVDLSLENGDLSFKTLLVHLVQARFTKGKDIRRLQPFFQQGERFFQLKISIVQFPWVNAITVIALIGTRLLQVQVNNLNQVISGFDRMRVYIYERRVHQGAKVAKIQNVSKRGY